MTLPNVGLGNIATDIGQGANTFAAGLLAQRQRQQQLALQEALAKSKSAVDQSTAQHLDAQTQQLIPAQAAEAQAQTGNVNAQAYGREQDNSPADDNDENILRQIDPTAPKGILQGHTKAQAQEYIKTLANYNAMKTRMQSVEGRFENRGQVVYSADGTGYVVRPNQPGGGGPEEIGGNIGKPLAMNERNMAGAAQAALSAHRDLINWERNHPQALDEIARAISLPNFGHMVPGLGSGISRVLQSFRLAGASPDAQAYLKRMFDFAGIVGPKRYGLRGMQSEVTLQQLWTDFGAGQFGLTPQGIEAAERNRENAILQEEESAGPRAMDQARGVFPQDQAPLGNSVPTTQPKPSVNPRFDPRSQR